MMQSDSKHQPNQIYQSKLRPTLIADTSSGKLAHPCITLVVLVAMLTEVYSHPSTSSFTVTGTWQRFLILGACSVRSEQFLK